MTNSHHPTAAQARTSKLRSSSGQISVDGDRLIVKFPYDPQKVIAIKTVPGRRWHRDARFWSVSRMHLLRDKSSILSSHDTPAQIASKLLPALLGK